MTKTNFPKGFLWGASTASHQVEGGTDTDWDRWERAHANKSYRSSKLLLGRLKNWPEIRAQAQLPETYIAGQAVDHYNRYEEDFKLVRELNMNTFRFSIEWARIEPREGEWDMAEIEHYRTYLTKLRAQGTEAFVSLWHFTSPTWFMDRGGFAKSANVALFTRYAEKIAEELGQMLTFVNPMNEPNTYVSMSYLAGLWPPQRHNLFTAVRVYKNMIAAHAEAYKVLKAHNPQMQVGTVTALNVDKLASRFPVARLTQWVWQRVAKYWFLDSVPATSDFVGVNFYMTNYYQWYGGVRTPSQPKNDLGWYMEPGAIGGLLVEVYNRYKQPVYVTENGLADNHDQYRQWWIEQTIAGMRSALGSGVDLRGYLHWSLLDNFEWAFGWLAEFGLVHVDRATMQRTIRPSAQWFGAEIARLRAEEKAE